MIELDLILRPISPLLIGGGMDVRNVRRSRPFIPGSVLRGSLAVEMIRAAEDMPGLKELFEALFLGDRPAMFDPLYPTYELSDEVIPAPVTAVTCKDYGVEHLLADTLISRMRPDRSSRQICPKCEGGRLERWRGFISRGKDMGYVSLSDVPRKMHVKVGLNRYTETAEEGILYALEAIEPKLIFQGKLRIDEGMWGKLEGFLKMRFKREDEGYRIRIGGGRARGYGLAILSFRRSSHVSIEERLEGFQGAIADPRHIYFTLTAISPVLILSETGESEMNLPAGMIAEWVEPIPEGTMVEAEELTGWSEAWGMPKPILQAIGAGSVFTFRAPASKRGELIPILRRIHMEGIGERRAEGLGRVSICDPFHLERIQAKS